MTIVQKIEADLTAAMKAKASDEIAALRLLKSLLHNETIAAKGELADNQALGALRKQAKKHEDSIQAFRTGNRPELAAREEKELTVLSRYLPPALSEEQIDKIVAEALAQAPGNNFGQVMKAAVTLAAGQVDGGVLAARIKAKLGS